MRFAWFVSSFLKVSEFKLRYPHELELELYFKLNQIQWKLDLTDTDLAENLDLKDTPQKIWATIFDF